LKNDGGEIFGCRLGYSDLQDFVRIRTTHLILRERYFVEDGEAGEAFGLLAGAGRVSFVPAYICCKRSAAKSSFRWIGSLPKLSL
jgi:hypothetical protein